MTAIRHILQCRVEPVVEVIRNRNFFVSKILLNGLAELKNGSKELSFPFLSTQKYFLRYHYKMSKLTTDLRHKCHK